MNIYDPDVAPRAYDEMLKGRTSMADFYLEFEVTDDKRFEALCRVFDALRAAKQSNSFPPIDDWLPYFDDEARSHFWWPSQDEARQLQEQWLSTPVEERGAKPSLQRPWLFGSMLDAICDGEYELISCSREGSSGRLEFEPYAGPYGGTGALQALIVAFGFRVTNDKG